MHIDMSMSARIYEKDGVSSHAYSGKDLQTTHVSMEREQERVQIYVYICANTQDGYIHTYTYTL